MRLLCHAFSIAGYILGISAILKLVDLLQNQVYLSLSDQAFPLLTYRSTILTGLLLDTLGAVVCLRSQSSVVRAVVIFWIGATFLGYHAAQGLLDVHGPCPCFGYLGRLEGVSPFFVNVLSLSIGLFLLGTGSAYFARCLFGTVQANRSIQEGASAASKSTR